MKIFAVSKQNSNTINILSESIGKIPHYSYCGICLYKCEYGEFILRDEQIPSLIYNISTIISNDHINSSKLQCIMIPTNTDTSKIQYNIINNIDENDDFLDNAQLLIKHNPCVMIIVTLNAGHILYFQTKNQDDEWQYTIVDFIKKTITSIPYYVANKTHISVGMSTSSIMEIFGKPLYIINSASNPNITQYIYSFGYTKDTKNSQNTTVDEQQQLEDEEKLEAIELYNIYSSYTIIITIDNDKVSNVEFNAIIK